MEYAVLFLITFIVREGFGTRGKDDHHRRLIRGSRPIFLFGDAGMERPESNRNVRRTYVVSRYGLIVDMAQTSTTVWY